MCKAEENDIRDIINAEYIAIFMSVLVKSTVIEKIMSRAILEHCTYFFMDFFYLKGFVLSK